MDHSDTTTANAAMPVTPARNQQTLVRPRPKQAEVSQALRTKKAPVRDRLETIASRRSDSGMIRSPRGVMNRVGGDVDAGRRQIAEREGAIPASSPGVKFGSPCMDSPNCQARHFKDLPLLFHLSGPRR